jgi:hypothetical protein
MAGFAGFGVVPYVQLEPVLMAQIEHIERIRPRFAPIERGNIYRAPAGDITLSE